MRYAVVSDVHGNLEALDAVLARVAEDDGLLCLGDLVGYGPNPNEVLARIRARATACVLGNHDLAATDGYGVEYFNPAAREAIGWTTTVLDADHVAWLNGLGYEFRLPELLMVHGAPVRYFDYIVSKDDAARAFEATDAPLILIGHTHVAEVYERAPDGAIERRSLQRGGVVELRDGYRYLVNVGSVGQPRDLNPEASFGFYEPDARRVTVERVAYPVERVREKIAEARLPDALGRRLLVGR